MTHCFFVMDNKYKVQHRMDQEYEVMELQYPDDSSTCDEPALVSVFQGSLADCEAYIRLHEQGYMS